MFLLWRDTIKCLQLILEHGSLCSRFTSWINITCLEAALCSSISLSLDPSHSHHSSCILSIVLLPLICKGYRLDVGQWRYRHAGWRTQRSPAALSALLSPWWPIHTGLQLSTPLLCATIMLSVMWGSELNADNMSSSVYLTLPVKVLAMS